MRIVRPVLLLASLTLAFGCQPPSPEAPTEVSELSRYLYREWANPDPEAMEAGLLNLWDFLADVDLESANVDRSWVPEVLEPEDVTDIQRPEDRELSALLAISMAGRSVWPVADHGALQMEEDQRPAEPTAPVYIRTPRNLSDVSCFPTRECGPVETDNEVRRENLLMAIDFDMRKDFRWARIGTPQEDEPERWALVGKSWFERSFDGDEGNTHLWQSYAIDVWMDDGDGTTVRYQALWSESLVVDGAEDQIVQNLLRTSIADIFEAGDAAIEELYHPPEGS